MATSIASEIFSQIKRFEYRIYCQAMIERDAVRMDEFTQFVLSATHYIDIRHCFVDGVFNPSHVLDYFTRYSGLDCNELRHQIIDIIREDRDKWIHTASVVLPLRPQGFDDWLMNMENLLTPCDELFVFALSKAHYRHTIVYNHKRAWCTIQCFEHLIEEALHAACNLHLIYLGQDVYGEVVLLADLPKSLQSFDAGVKHSLTTDDNDGHNDAVESRNSKHEETSNGSTSSSSECDENAELHHPQTAQDMPLTPSSDDVQLYAETHHKTSVLPPCLVLCYLSDY